MSQSDLKDDVDRLFACFKCGVNPPESAFKEKRPRQRVEGASRKVVATPESPEGGSIEEDKCCKSASLAIKLKCGKKFSPVVFYGSPQGLPMKRPLRLLKLLHEIRIDLTKQNDFSKSKEVWATFPRQEEAVKFAKSHSQVFVFSYQDHLNGQRRFLASTYEEFWQRYKNMNPKVRHHYEVIQEGFPCHLYFDLEFNKRINKEKNADEMVDILLSITFDALKEKYSIDGKHEWVVELDSSTEEKFSRHLIFHLPRTAFKDNSHAGAFVSEISSRIENAGANDPKLEKLYIKKESLSSSCDNLFLDNAVYSRNRCFRLVFSSKSGKKSFLLPTGRFRCKNLEEKQVFMESLICRMDVDCSKILICKQDPTFQKALNFEFEVNEPHIIPKELVPKGSTGQHLSGRSPFPSLDSFVESIASNGKIPGRIRSWYFFSEYGLMVYSMLRNRYCERIGREHKSNHVMYIVDFRREGYYQKCYDPDCKGYRSPMRPIPLDVIPNGVTLVNSVERECCEEVLRVKFDQVLKENLEVPSCANVESIADRCKENSDWWQEAVRFAEYIENGNEWIEDQEWWMDVEKSMIHLEHQRGQMLCT